MRSGHESPNHGATVRPSKRVAAAGDAENPETRRPPEKAAASQKNVRTRRPDRCGRPEMLLPPAQRRRGIFVNATRSGAWSITNLVLEPFHIVYETTLDRDLPIERQSTQ